MKQIAVKESNDKAEWVMRYDVQIFFTIGDTLSGNSDHLGLALDEEMNYHL